MKIRIILFMFALAAFAYAANPVIIEEDTELILLEEDTTKAIKGKDVNIKKDQKKYEVQAGASINTIWLDYENPMKDWRLHPWISFSISGLFILNIAAPFSIETGARIAKIGNRTDFKGDPRNTVVRLPIIDTSLFDSSKAVYGKFQMNIYNASVPLKFYLNLKGVPLSLLSGFDVGYILYADGWIDHEDDNLEDSKDKYTKALNRLNANWIFGVKFQKSHIAVRLEGYWGITNLVDDSWYSGFKACDVSLSIHYVF